jgi:hypothetical protein
VKGFVEPADFRMFEFYFDCSVRLRRDISVCKPTREESISCMSLEVILCASRL